jgi:hypothetical protein
VDNIKLKSGLGNPLTLLDLKLKSGQLWYKLVKNEAKNVTAAQEIG